MSAQSWSRGRAVVAFVGVLSLVACASTNTVRPSPFPTAPPAILEAPTTAVPAPAAVLVEAALNLRGVPYKMGGETPQGGFDCSGYVKYVFALVHVDLPRTVSEQFRAGTSTSLKNLRAGDLVFFTTTAPGATHVAIALGPTEFIHAPSSTGVVRVESLTSSYWSPRVVGARHVLQ